MTERPEKRGYALITGASTGIGAELARVFAEQGHDLILVARSENRLAALAGELAERDGVKVVVRPQDLARPGGAEELARWATDEGLDVAYLVNNAGFGEHGPVATTPPERYRALIELNVQALTELSSRLVGAMVARGSGGILNVASTAAFQPGPWMAVYYASKAYVLSFTEALHRELEGTGVVASTLCPGPTKSEFFERANMSGLTLAEGPFVMEARPVAELGYRALMKGRPVAVAGILNRAGSIAASLLPRRLVTAVVARIQRPR